MVKSRGRSNGQTDCPARPCSGTQTPCLWRARCGEVCVREGGKREEATSRSPCSKSRSMYFGEHDVVGCVGHGKERERERERQQVTSASRYTPPYTGLYRGIWSRVGGDRMCSSVLWNSKPPLFQGSGFRVQGAGFRVQGSGFGIWA